MSWDDYPRYTLTEFMDILNAVEEREEEARVRLAYYITSMVMRGLTEGLPAISHYLPQAPPKKVDPDTIRKEVAKVGLKGPT